MNEDIMMSVCHNVSMQISAASPLPLYAQVESAIAADIVDGRLAPGAQLPPEDALVAQYRVSRTTIRTAIQNLVNRNVLEIRRGRGTFVCEKKITSELTELTGFVEDMTSLGLSASARVLEKTIVEADEMVARNLQILVGQKVVKIRRVRIGDGVPLSLDETYLLLHIGEKLLSEDLETQPIFTLLEQKYGVPLVSATYVLEAVNADRVVADSLSIAAGSPIFLIERTSYTNNGTPVDYEKLHYRGDKVRFQTQLQRNPR
jgi:GntR family transcriptional regulator